MGESSDDIDQMFSNLLGEMDLLTQSLGVDTLPPPDPEPTRAEFNYTVGFKDLNESLNALEDKDLDALMADLVADISEAEQRTIQAQKAASQNQRPSASLEESSNFSGAASLGYEAIVAATSIRYYEDDLPPPPANPMLDLPLPPPPPEPLSQEEEAAQAKADKIKLALEKLKEAKVKKLVVKVHMNDNSTKSLMVDERQLARDVLDNLFEKTHCDYHVDWCLYEIYPELQIERLFEDHENVVEVLSDWTRDTENKLLFLEKEEKYAVFKNPQNFYLDNKGKKEGKETNEKMNAKNKESLLEESFCGTSVIVPELEGALYLKEDGKKSWKRRYFLLRASGIYYVPKGKSKTSRDLACFIQFENVNVYYGIQCKMKYKAPTDYCFVLKHPQIQKESQYIKYLCCDDARTLNQWITGVRIAKYGKTLYDNYQRAVSRAGLASRWTNLGTVNPATPAQLSTGFKPGTSQPNGQIPQAAHSVSAVLAEVKRQVEPPKNNVPALGNQDLKAPRAYHLPKSSQPPPPPIRRSSDTSCSPVLPSKPKSTAGVFPAPPDDFLPPPPPPPLEEVDLPLPPPPPPPDFHEAPPDFVPPPPLATAGVMGSLLPPPPPPPTLAPESRQLPHTVARKLPVPPKRQENPGPPSGGESGEQDFMSDLMKALQKKRGNMS
ncbi:amyloid beta A4 precursor protein-binding family B member 1-interacting protein isoform X1 [Trichechus manatus latirostris]|uniref:Amyloid beta A4 precursor protein-binding family B member 1-interacting protein n=2 Tax=Trichechus manatus latirostris TaxID=127582 RepID=A0A2Y9R8I3_TRIMA|nr:amyloid beta A4 precursor protein-binding family B member 1-interacting protein isoform X1 [Trichechus manatus latirostris]XP_023590779.1 amyloid beta A4 precursor protein-binding family B member 1-interacting protein isoform X1 [Trichechus manatus latirostris]XP_023590781.1 amyloid beta A4 precursor protein-binding family B member 1-interacting protein isoform X1 [Trichechus manatus latirostris]XP_023590782.1 amyloid beta A4 precursor protein-binding family B member 1-interacting protein iso